MRKLISLLSIGCVFLLCGCGSTYNIRTTGFLDKGSSQTQLAKGSSFAVIQNDKAENPILDKEVKKKIEYLLSKNGYRVVTPDKADYMLSYVYAIDGGRTVSVPSAIPSNSKSKVSMNFGDTTSTEFTRSLILSVYDGDKFRKDKTLQVVWYGDTLSMGTSSDLREVMDFLLIGAFQHFGQDTGKQQRISIGGASPEAKELNEAIRQ
jgi:hypothetical protein